MSLRKIAAFEGSARIGNHVQSVKVIVRYDSDLAEYVAAFYHRDYGRAWVRREAADSFTSDKADAIATARTMCGLPPH